MKELIIFITSIILIISTNVDGKSESDRTIHICYDTGAGFQEQLAAKEIRRYLYLRTGELYEIESLTSIPFKGDLILIANKENGLLNALSVDTQHLKSQEYSIKTIDQNKRKILIICGGDPVGTLYGAYHFAEILGVRFYLHGDVIPDEKIQFMIPDLDETGKPLFRLRGILPYHDFPEGPDWWQHNDYKAVVSQLPKMRMNFLGLHTYFGEPTVWFGMEKDVYPNGNVKFSAPARYSNTSGSFWGYAPLKTSAFSAGSSLLFDRDLYGADFLQDYFPYPETDDEMNEVYNVTGQLYNDVFSQARKLGVKTCMGTELSTLFPPTERVRQRLKESGIDPESSEATKEVYRGIFRRIQRTHPLDYYWLWTQEGWVVNVFPKPVNEIVNDLENAIEAWKEVDPEFNLATCGWTLGPPDDVTLFDRIMPEGAAISSINIHVGLMPVVTDFAKIKNRPTWAIPWLEDDMAMVSPQLWAGRMRRDAADAHAYGCDGLMGIHWRTRELGPQISALAKAGWSQTEWNEEFGKPVVIPPPASNDIRVGGLTSYTIYPIVGTEDDRVYQHIREKLNAYHIELPNGTYKVTLQFCEIKFDQPGQRIFDVVIQGKEGIKDLDICSRVGKNSALDITFEKVKIKENRLLIEFVSKVQSPSISGIVIESEENSQPNGAAFTRKINCGGQAYGHYETDFPAKGEIPDPSKPRDLPVDDFYEDWVRSQFGQGAAKELTDLFVQLDGGPQVQFRKDTRANLPRTSRWDGPGGIIINPRPWEEVSQQFRHVNEMASLRPQIKGKGNLERFDYWLNTLRYNRYLGELGCLRGQLDLLVYEIKNEEDASIRKKLVTEKVIPIRIQLSKLWEEMITCKLQIVTNAGEMGTIANLEQHNRTWLKFLSKHDEYLKSYLGPRLPLDFKVTLDYNGPARLIVPTIRTQIESDEQLGITAIILDQGKTANANLCWHPLGEGSYQTIPLSHCNRGVYKVTLPEMDCDFEYYIEAESGLGQKLLFPATAPGINQTIIVINENESL